ncbi:hypothetical protein [Fodinicurvata sediminis]|uniref:hypothetical protein n=1 Tax=Fodinicurvata sediminis TaxID=1121832 RepID=UPI0003B37613|nr:hypothetical protein [Fodinicurvata sediminis]
MAKTRPGKRWSHQQRIEDGIQIGCVDILERFVPNPQEGGPAWTAINPLPHKTKAVAGKSKAMGLRKGWPDLLMIWKGRPVLFEFKPPHVGLPPKEQRDRHDEITMNGGVVFIIRSVEEFIEALHTIGVPCSARNLKAPETVAR